jgi:hypothetical protein
MICFWVYTTKSWLSHTPNDSYRTLISIPHNALNNNVNSRQNPQILNRCRARLGPVHYYQPGGFSSLCLPKLPSYFFVLHATLGLLMTAAQKG